MMYDVWESVELCHDTREKRSRNVLIHERKGEEKTSNGTHSGTTAVYTKYQYAHHCPVMIKVLYVQGKVRCLVIVHARNKKSPCVVKNEFS